MTSDEFHAAWKSATPAQREWLQHKADWEQMTLWGVANGWGIPTDEEARQLLGEKEPRHGT